MRIAFIADGRSSHTINWLKYFVEKGDIILLLTTFSSPKILGVRTHILSGMHRLDSLSLNNTNLNSNRKRSVLASFTSYPKRFKAVNYIWQQIRVLNTIRQSKEAQAVLKEFQPDVVHCLRIQNESYIGVWTKYHPLIMSSWGSDFTFTAKRFPVHRILTRLTMRKPEAFFADCLRDIHLAQEYGLSKAVLTYCFPGNGGIDLSLFHSGYPKILSRERIILYTRGYSSIARIDTLFNAFKTILSRERYSGTQLILVVSDDVLPIIERMREKFNLSELYVKIITSISVKEMVHLLQIATVSVSPMTSDGIPISMLEAMACGAFPVMSNLESIREWISHGINGLLFDPDNPDDLASCLEEALDNVSLRQRAQNMNSKLIIERADYNKIMPQIRELYQMVSHKYKQPVQVKPENIFYHNFNLKK
jgi:glycosyltransferase involved in cell wall biosynthesis